MDASALELIQIYRQRAATWQAAYERVSAENLRLREQLEQMQQHLLNRAGTGECG